MSNHPSRGWRRRAHEAAASFVASWNWRPDAAAYVLTQQELADIMSQAVIAGYGLGRLDRHAAPSIAPRSDA